MIALFNATKTYPRINREGQVVKCLTFDAVFIREGSFTSTFRANKLNRQFYDQSGIDKIGLILPLDYVNEDVAKPYKFTNGMFTTRIHAGYLHIDVHGEYLEVEKNLLDQIKPIIHYLCSKSFFKVPRIKNTIELSEKTGEVINCREKQFQEIPENISQFETIIYKNIVFTNLELKFDFQRAIIDLLDSSDFNTFEGTLYSKDYKVYRSGKRIKSSLCIYDKARQLDEVKNKSLSTKLYRVEFRVFSQTLKYYGGMKLLDQTFISLLQRLRSTIANKLRRLEIDFSQLIVILPQQDLLRCILNKDECVDNKISECIENAENTKADAEHIYKYVFLVFALIRTKVIKLSENFSCLIKTPRPYMFAFFSLGP